MIPEQLAFTEILQFIPIYPGEQVQLLGAEHTRLVPHIGLQMALKKKWVLKVKKQYSRPQKVEELYPLGQLQTLGEIQVPIPRQLAVQIAWLQVDPVQPVLHEHVLGAIQLPPAGRQGVEQTGISHRVPFHPLLQTHCFFFFEIQLRDNKK